MCTVCIVHSSQWEKKISFSFKGKTQCISWNIVHIKGEPSLTIGVNLNQGWHKETSRQIYFDKLERLENKKTRETER